MWVMWQTFSIAFVLTVVVVSGEPMDIHLRRATTCNRQQSREAAAIWEEEVLPLAKAVGVPIAPGCSASPERSVFVKHEQMKDFSSSEYATCTSCGKHFRDESFLDRHLQSKHADVLGDPPEATLCLADHCRFLGCPSLLREEEKKEDVEDVDPREEWNACMRMFHSCFEVKEVFEWYRSASELVATLADHYCDPALTVRDRAQRRKGKMMPWYKEPVTIALGVILSLTLLITCAVMLADTVFAPPPSHRRPLQSSSRHERRSRPHHTTSSTSESSSRQRRRQIRSSSPATSSSVAVSFDTTVTGDEGDDETEEVGGVGIKTM